MDIFEKFAYEFRRDPSEAVPGTRVVVPFGRRVVTGWITGKSSYSGKVKPVIGVVNDKYSPDSNLLEFAGKVSNIFIVSVGKLLDKSLSPMMRSLKNIIFTDENNGNIHSLSNCSYRYLSGLSSEKEIIFSYKKRPVSNISVNHGHSKPDKSSERILDLSNDVWGFYNKLAEDQTGNKGTYLIIIPPAFAGNSMKLLPKLITMYGSRLKSSRREEIWGNIEAGNPMIIAGGESVLFLPFKNLTGIVIERPGALGGMKNPYSPVDLSICARILSESFGINLIERDFTYSVENFERRKSIIVKDSRVNQDIKVFLEKLKPKDIFIPENFTDKLREKFFEGSKILVVSGRRGSIDYFFCKNCKKVIHCPNCRGTLIKYRDKGSQCRKCSFETFEMPKCPHCNGISTQITGISLDSLKKAAVDVAGEANVSIFNPVKKQREKKHIDSDNDSGVKILSPREIDLIFETDFDYVFFFKPESYFNLGSYNGAELIYSSLSKLKSLLKNGGELHIYSTFHFHYVFKNLENEADFFKRELKYRKFISLPPYENMYELEIREKTIRSLGKKLRIYIHNYKNELDIRRVFLSSRKPERGFYKGKMEIHCHSDKMASSGILKNKNLKVVNVIA